MITSVVIEGMVEPEPNRIDTRKLIFVIIAGCVSVIDDNLLVDPLYALTDKG